MKPPRSVPAGELHRPAEGRDAIEREADAADSSLADVMRDAIERGLPLVRDARRKRQRSRART